MVEYNTIMFLSWHVQETYTIAVRSSLFRGGVGTELIRDYKSLCTPGAGINGQAGEREPV